MDTIRIGLIGDYNEEVVAHRAIPLALGFSSELVGRPIGFDWLPTETLAGSLYALRDYDGLWCVPASPYRNMEGALNSIRYARESSVPFLGTCGGFQHALIEYARNVLGIEDADHAESNPDASVLFVTPLTCALRAVKGTVKLKPGSMAARIYGKDEVLEEYNCGFGLNPDYRELLEKSAIQVTGADTTGDVRIIELPTHPFFLATLYQPERASMAGAAHPLVTAFVKAVLDSRESHLSAPPTPAGRSLG